MKSQNASIFLHIMPFLIITTCCGMGTSEKAPLSTEEGYIELAAHEPIYEGTISDGKVILEVDHLSFGGKTSLKYVPTESDTFKGELDLATIKQIDIVQPNYTSQRFSDQELTLVDVTYHKNDVQEKNLLLPRKLLICGIDKKTGRGKGAFVFRLSTIKVSPTPQLEEKEEEADTKDTQQNTSTPPQDGSILQKAKDAAHYASTTVLSYARKAGQALASAVKKTTSLVTQNAPAEKVEAEKVEAEKVEREKAI